MITKAVIESLKPCKDRYDNYVKYYGDKALTKAQFLGRKNITQSDKLWVAFRLIDHKALRLAVADIAESVLHIYEAKYPNDDRPRKAIQAARNGTVEECRAAANASNAAYATYSANASYAAAANAAAYAADAADVTYAAYAAYYASYTAAYAINAATDKPKQEKLIRKIILKYWKNS